jgi:hypothetical protein
VTTYVKVCFGCPLRHVKVPGLVRPRRCSILQEKLNGIRGFKLKAIDFDCPTKTALFRPGQSVKFLGANRGTQDEADYYEEFSGFVMGWRGNKVRVVSEETESPFCNIPPSRLEAGSEPSRRACIHCGMPEGIKPEVKTKWDEKPRPWVCRSDVDEEFRHIELPCVYRPEPSSNQVEKPEVAPQKVGET